MVLQNELCEKCGEQYTEYKSHKWCKPCQINYLKQNFTNWTSGNKKIDNFIQEIQLKIFHFGDIIFEWIPYNQFYNIKGLNKYKIFSAIWKDGPLEYNIYKKLYKRNLKNQNQKVSLKCFNSQDTDEFFNEV